MVGVWVMFGLLSLLMHTWCKWFLWGGNCQHLLVNQPLQLKPISHFFPGTAGTSHQGLKSEVISTRLSRMLLVDELRFLHHPLHWISLWVLEHSGSLCNRGMITLLILWTPACVNTKLHRDEAACSETIAETYLSTLIRVMCLLLLH